MKYLSHFISKNGVQADPPKIEAMVNFSVPKSQKESKSYLGLTNYYRKFIYNYSVIVSPLNRLLKKDLKNLSGLRTVKRHLKLSGRPCPQRRS